MNKDMVYAAFYQLMVEPDKYIGKTLCIDGLYYTGQNEKTGTYYHYSIITKTSHTPNGLRTLKIQYFS